jgi:hypothetical protein
LIRLTGQGARPVYHRKKMPERFSARDERISFANDFLLSGVRQFSRNECDQ